LGNVYDFIRKNYQVTLYDLLNIIPEAIRIPLVLYNYAYIMEIVKRLCDLNLINLYFNDKQINYNDMDIRQIELEKIKVYITEHSIYVQEILT